MKLHRVTAPAALLIATLCVGMGTAYAAPTPADQAVISHTSLSADGRSVGTALDAGHFTLSRTAAAVDIVNDSGTPVGTIPCAIRSPVCSSRSIRSSPTPAGS